MSNQDSQSTTSEHSIDRSALIERHHIRMTALDPLSPLQVGNGNFAFSVDVTGLQTLPASYPVEAGGTLLGTMSHWGWHSISPDRPYELSESFRTYPTPHGAAPYVDLAGALHDAPDQLPAESWLRGNPHRLDLGRVGLWTQPGISEQSLSSIEQDLDLATGIVTSNFTSNHRRYAVQTAVHAERDMIGISANGPPEQTLGVRFRFPYGSEAWANAADWTRPDAHATTTERTPSGWRLNRTVDATDYFVTVTGDDLEVLVLGPHDIVFHGVGSFHATIEFSQEHPSRVVATAQDVLESSRRHWAGFWASGGAVELAASDHPDAAELERRVVLSQYLTAINSAGPLPPAETGLMLNSWRGKFHLEMHWWHAGHFAAWGRPELLERSLGWYETILPKAQDTARRQRLSGARWPKQIGPEGEETPSNIGPFLVWQQPSPIYLAHLVYRAHPDVETLERWAEIIFNTAEFMASFASHGRDGFELGSPIVPSQESYFETRATAKNPTFELAYWSWALGVAAEWFDKLGKRPPQRWLDVSQGMTPPHQVDGIYAALATPPFLVRNDHPSMLAGLGVIPQTELIDPAVMNRTFDNVWSDWDWQTTWGWDYPMAAMTATRLSRPTDATAALLLDTPKNTYLANGHNRQTATLPIYLPGNGGLLMAIALMTAGWDGCESPSPGFDATWKVSHEGILPLP